MEQETVVAAPSAAQETPAIEVERGPLVNLTPEERTEYKKTGTLPKPEAPATSATPEKPEGESDESDTPEADAGTGKQEHTTRKTKPTAEDRIRQLEETIEKIRKGAGLERKTEPAPVAQQTENQPPRFTSYDAWETEFIEKEAPKWVEQWGKDHPEATYESATAAMNRYMRNVERQFEQSAQQGRELQGKVNEARQRYGDKFDEVLTPTLNVIVGSQQVAPVIKQLINESEVLPDLMFTLGSSQEELNKFLAMPPGKQARYVALTESLIREELEGKSQPKPAPAQPKTSAPKPPAEVGGRAASPGDELESAAKAGDFRRFKAEANRRALAQLKG